MATQVSFEQGFDIIWHDLPHPVICPAQVELRSDQTSSCFMKGTLLNGKEYVFSNMHFHWGSNQNQGSEHTVNGRR